MAAINTPADVISLLQDIERRNKQKVAGLSQPGDLSDAWSGIGFRSGKEYFLIPLDESREVFPVPKLITPIPKSQPWAWGAANLRGELLPICDLNYFLKGTPTKLSKRSRVMVINHPNLYSGLLVDEVFGLKHFQQKPETHNENMDVNITPYLRGTILQQDINWNVFSFHQLADDARFLNAAA